MNAVPVETRARFKFDFYMLDVHLTNRCNLHCDGSSHVRVQPSLWGHNMPAVTMSDMTTSPALLATLPDQPWLVFP